MNNLLTPKFLGAILMSVLAHKEQKRKCGDTPYVVHPIAVLSLLIKWEADEDTCIAGVLHDVLEDAPDDEKEMYRERIKEEFGPDVLAIVESVTEQDKSLPWKERKKQYLEHLKTASDESVLISCADMTHNLNSLVEAYREQGEDVWKHFNAIKQWKVWFIDRRVEMLKERLSEKYVKELCSHQTELNILIIQSASSGPLLRLEDENDEKAVFSCDPLYQELWDYCNLTEEEMESGVLDEDKRVMERASAATDEEDEDEPDVPLFIKLDGNIASITLIANQEPEITTTGGIDINKFIENGKFITKETYDELEKKLKPYVIRFWDNFYFVFEDDEGSPHYYDRFATEEEAIAVCKEITIDSVMNQYEEGISIEKIEDKYLTFGFEPFIVYPDDSSEDGRTPFSASDFLSNDQYKTIIRIVENSPLAKRKSKTFMLDARDKSSDEVVDILDKEWNEAADQPKT
ncbi:HD domain-containing protein [Patescibacteria group bacterium]|nr:HD domain-containing protein [Patescibacteria group bacterium]